MGKTLKEIMRASVQIKLPLIIRERKATIQRYKGRDVAILTGRKRGDYNVFYAGKMVRVNGIDLSIDTDDKTVPVSYRDIKELYVCKY
jgi:hypothetical protein